MYIKPEWWMVLLAVSPFILMLVIVAYMYIKHPSKLFEMLGG